MRWVGSTLTGAALSVGVSWVTSLEAGAPTTGESIGWALEGWAPYAEAPLGGGSCGMVGPRSGLDQGLDGTGAQIGAADLAARCRDSMANYKVPRRFVFVDELPLNATGKVQKFVLRDRLAQEDA